MDCGWFATQAATVAIMAYLDLLGNMLANGALMKLGEPIIHLVDRPWLQKHETENEVCTLD